MGLAIMGFTSCSDNFFEQTEQEPESTDTITVCTESGDELKSDFAQALSSAIAVRKDVREFLKEQALTQFDKNYDILYIAVKDKKISGHSFRDILASYCSEEKLAAIERSIPLLNIYLTKIAPLGVYPEELDTSDDEIPTAVAMPDSTHLYVNGKHVESIAKGDVPDFHVFVVGENQRVVINKVNNGNLKSVPLFVFAFKDPVFDGTKGTETAA